MTRYPLHLALLALLLTSTACRHHANSAPRYSHEEALPVSNLPHEDFSRVSPHRCGRHCTQH